MIATLEQPEEVRLADRYCAALLGGHRENFLVSAPVLPALLRLHLARIYAYCRTTDDIGDESGGHALERLASWRQDVERCFGGPVAPLHPVLVALRATVVERALPRQPFLDLIDANEQDQRIASYADWPALLDYCRRSAMPVGRMVLHLFGVEDERLTGCADDVCAGLQLANFAQDVLVDRAKGRTYLPQNEIEARGLRGAIEATCDRAAALLDSGRELEAAFEGGLRLQLALYRLGGFEIVEAIRELDYRTDVRRPELSRATQARLLARAWFEAYGSEPPLAWVSDVFRGAAGALELALAAPQPLAARGTAHALGFVRGTVHGLARPWTDREPAAGDGHVTRTAVRGLAPGRVVGRDERTSSGSSGRRLALARTQDGAATDGVVLPPVSREAAQRCAAIARREAKNFYWGFLALPWEQRTAIYGLYGFAREVDDVADLPVPGGVREPAPARAWRLAELERHRERLRRCAAGDTAGDPGLEVLAWAIRRFNIPIGDLDELVAGVEMDLESRTYASWGELETYCARVAASIGRVCVRVFGFDDGRALEHGHRLGLAMQLTNILRDVREDLDRGRLYLPLDDLARFGLDPAAFAGPDPGPAWAGFVRFEAARARGLFDDGRQVVQYVPHRSAACVLTMAGIYEDILGRIERDPYLPLRVRVSLPARVKLAVALRSWLQAA